MAALLKMSAIFNIKYYELCKTHAWHDKKAIFQNGNINHSSVSNWDIKIKNKNVYAGCDVVIRINIFIVKFYII